MDKPTTSRRSAVPLKPIAPLISLLLTAFLPLAPIYAEEAPAKVVVPDAAAISIATSAMLDVYGAELAKAKTPDKQAAIAKKLLTVSADVKDAPTRYVTLSRARDLALQGNDATTGS